MKMKGGTIGVDKNSFLCYSYRVDYQHDWSVNGDGFDLADLSALPCVHLWTWQTWMFPQLTRQKTRRVKSLLFIYFVDIGDSNSCTSAHTPTWPFPFELQVGDELRCGWKLFPTWSSFSYCKSSRSLMVKLLAWFYFWHGNEGSSSHPAGSLSLISRMHVCTCGEWDP